MLISFKRLGTSMVSKFTVILLSPRGVGVGGHGRDFEEGVGIGL